MKKIILIENFGSDFYEARLSYAKFLQRNGYRVFALVPNDNFVKLIENEGIETFSYDFSRKNKGPLQLFHLARLFSKVFKENEIDIVHSYRFQPNLLNVMANIFSKRKVFLHVTGLGLAFSNSNLKYLILRFISQLIFQFKLMFANRVIFQNDKDFGDLWFNRVWGNKVSVVEGSGVDIKYYRNEGIEREAIRAGLKVGPKDVVFICTTRLLWEKGIREMVDAFLSLQKEGLPVKLWIVGWSDHENPRHVEKSYVDQFTTNEVIHFLGKRSDVKQLSASADVCIYPSYYREGIPRALLEALAMGLPIITTDMPGCNLTVEENINGFLIGPKSVPAIIESVKKMLDSVDFPSYGRESRRLAETKFSQDIIFEKIKNLYKE